MNRVILMEVSDQLREINTKLDLLIELVKPVAAHAGWVDALREKLASLRIIPNNRIEQSKNL